MPIVLYLTTDCNLKCEYCYELENRKKLKKPLELNVTDIKKQLDESYKDKENVQGNCIVLFGGEPLLKYDLIKELFELNKKDYENYFCFAITTNGTLINEEIIEDIREYSKIMTVSLGISYDGTGTYRRCYPNGESAERSILEKIELVNKTNLPFGISYTVHKGNCSVNVLLKDIITLFEKYPNNLNKIELSVYSEEIEQCTGIDAYTFMHSLMDKLVSVYKVYHKPICCAKLKNDSKNYTHEQNSVCKLCKMCIQIDDRIYVTKSEILKKGQYENDPDFAQWKDE